jgi:hypothetical protein
MGANVQGNRPPEAEGRNRVEPLPLGSGTFALSRKPNDSAPLELAARLVAIELEKNVHLSRNTESVLRGRFFITATAFVGIEFSYSSP